MSSEFRDIKPTNPIEWHKTFIKYGESVVLKKCMEANLDYVTRFYCPFCDPQHFHATRHFQVQKHLGQLHWSLGVQFKDIFIVKCFLLCDGQSRGHYHCPVCPECVNQRENFVTHLHKHLTDQNESVKLAYAPHSEQPSDLLYKDFTIRICSKACSNNRLRKVNHYHCPGCDDLTETPGMMVSHLNQCWRLTNPEPVSLFRAEKRHTLIHPREAFGKHWHKSVVRDRADIPVSQCAFQGLTKMFHCPLCTTKKQTPSTLPELHKHFSLHLQSAVIHKGYILLACHLNCKAVGELLPDMHYHCPLCGICVSSRLDFTSHLQTCYTKKPTVTQEDITVNAEDNRVDLDNDTYVCSEEKCTIIQPEEMPPPDKMQLLDKTLTPDKMSQPDNKQQSDKKPQSEKKRWPKKRRKKRRREKKPKLDLKVSEIEMFDSVFATLSNPFLNALKISDAVTEFLTEVAGAASVEVCTAPGTDPRQPSFGLQGSLENILRAESCLYDKFQEVNQSESIKVKASVLNTVHATKETSDKIQSPPVLASLLQMPQAMTELNLYNVHGSEDSSITASSSQSTQTSASTVKSSLETAEKKGTCQSTSQDQNLQTSRTTGPLGSSQNAELQSRIQTKTSSTRQLMSPGIVPDSENDTESGCVSSQPVVPVGRFVLDPGPVKGSSAANSKWMATKDGTDTTETSSHNSELNQKLSNMTTSVIQNSVPLMIDKGTSTNLNGSEDFHAVGRKRPGKPQRTALAEKLRKTSVTSDSSGEQSFSGQNLCTNSPQTSGIQKTQQMCQAAKIPQKTVKDTIVKNQQIKIGNHIFCPSTEGMIVPSQQISTPGRTGRPNNSIRTLTLVQIGWKDGKSLYRPIYSESQLKRNIVSAQEKSDTCQKLSAQAVSLLRNMKTNKSVISDQVKSGKNNAHALGHLGNADSLKSTKESYDPAMSENIVLRKDPVRILSDFLEKQSCYIPEVKTGICLGDLVTRTRKKTSAMSSTEHAAPEPEQQKQDIAEIIDSGNGMQHSDARNIRADISSVELVNTTNMKASDAISVEYAETELDKQEQETIETSYTANGREAGFPHAESEDDGISQSGTFCSDTSGDPKEVLNEIETFKAEQNVDAIEVKEVNGTTLIINQYQTCKICGQKYGDPKFLYAHIMFSHFKFKCHFCASLFTKKELLVEHLKLPSTSKLSCSSRSGRLALHCGDCCSYFYTRTRLDTHQHEAHGVPVRCSVCGETFSGPTLYDLYAHIRYNHFLGQKSLTTLTCDVCGKSFAKKDYLRSHRKRHFAEKKHMCSICGKCFKDGWTLKEHEAIHKPEGERQYRYTCSTCGKRFNCKPKFRDHQNVHSGEMPYECKYCDQKFFSSDKLRSHEWIKHTKEKPHSCEFCNKSFKRKSHLNIHKLIHTTQGKYKCQHCQQAFRHSRLLKTHMTRCGKSDSGETETAVNVSAELPGVERAGNCLREVVPRTPSKQEDMETDHMRDDAYVYMCTACDEEFDDMIMAQIHIEHCG